MYEQRLSDPTPSPSEKRAAPEPEDDVSLWAHQCEPKIHKISDPLLHEDLMDHLSLIIKQASRGQWSVDNVQAPAFAQALVPIPSQLRVAVVRTPPPRTHQARYSTATLIHTPPQ